MPSLGRIPAVLALVGPSNRPLPYNPGPQTSTGPRWLISRGALYHFGLAMIAGMIQPQMRLQYTVLAEEFRKLFPWRNQLRNRDLGESVENNRGIPVFAY